MTKRCNVCALDKAPEAYAKRRASNDRLCATCKICARERARRWRETHPNAFVEWYLQNKLRRAEYWQRWRSLNGDRARAGYKRWAKANPDKVTANVMNRQTQKQRAMPSWANRERIAAVYTEALRRTAETGIRHDVDHIVPIRSRIVCGLHWEGNLQILTKDENRKKSNRLVA
jgi:hypothetical protein